MPTDTALAHRLLQEAPASLLAVGADGALAVEGVSVAALAQDHGTPLFVYSAGAMRAALAGLREALGARVDVYYSIKANPHPAVVRVLFEAGAGAEIASGAEYEAARRAGVPPQRILFAGPGKSTAELRHVITRGIGEIHLEAMDEIERVGALAAEAGVRQPVSLRINPVAAAAGGSMRMGGKPAQFGIDEEALEAHAAACEAQPALRLCGLHLFAGTQVLDADTLLRQWAHGLELARRLAQRLGRPLDTVDLGGGLGIPYLPNDAALDLARLREGALELFGALAHDPWLADARLIVEPGRYLAGPAGVYVARVTSVKDSRGQCFAVTDGGMHHHLAASGNLGQVIKRDYPLLMASRALDPHTEAVTVCGPLCTPLDTWGRTTPLPAPRVGDLVAILQSGAYGLSASPVGFLSQPMPAEVLVDDGRASVIRAAGTFEAPISPVLLP